MSHIVSHALVSEGDDNAHYTLVCSLYGSDKSESSNAKSKIITRVSMTQKRILNLWQIDYELNFPKSVRHMHEFFQIK